MKEVKNPQRPMAFYYGIALLVILLFNSMAKPYMEEAKIEQVDYGTFMSMTEEKKVTGSAVSPAKRLSHSFSALRTTCPQPGQEKMRRLASAYSSILRCQLR